MDFETETLMTPVSQAPEARPERIETLLWRAAFGSPRDIHVSLATAQGDP